MRNTVTFKTLQKLNFRKTASKSSSVLHRIPEGTKLSVTGTSIRWADSVPFVKVSYKGKQGYVNGRYLRGLLLKTKDRESERYPKLAVISSGKASRRILIPQQKQFVTFSVNHGCSLAAGTVALQLHGILKSPTEIYNYAKKHIGGYTGSKLTIFGTAKVLNRIAGKKIATWKSFPSGANARVRRDIKSAIMNGYIVLLEQKNPIHTNAIIGRDIKGRYIIATNGYIKRVTMNWLIQTALHGKDGRKNQKNWFKGSQYGAGYVIVKK